MRNDQSKNKKCLNKFNRSFGGVKNFLRQVSYGCYHRSLFERHEIKPRSYDDFIRQLRFFIPDDKIQVSHHKKFAYVSFVGDFRRGSFNYLHRAFLTKTLLPEQCLQYVLILQLLKRGEPMTLLELVEGVIDAAPSLNELGDIFQALRRRLNELTDAGLISKIGSGGRLLYRRVDNPLVDLSSNDQNALTIALDFYRNCSMMSVPGYLLSMTLELEAPSMFQFRNDNFTRILDDDLVLTIIQALNERRRLLIDRRKKRSLTAIPLALETDFLYDRQYLAAWKVSERGLEPVRLRLDEITSLKLGEPIDRITSTNTERLREIVLRVTFDNDAQRREHEQIIRARFDMELTVEGENYFECRLLTLDPLRIYPWLWRWQPWAEILSGKLRSRMLDDANEALKNYADTL